MAVNQPEQQRSGIQGSYFSDRVYMRYQPVMPVACKHVLVHHTEPAMATAGRGATEMLRKKRPVLQNISEINMKRIAPNSPRHGAVILLWLEPKVPPLPRNRLTRSRAPGHRRGHGSGLRMAAGAPGLVEEPVTADEAIALISKAKAIVEGDMGVKVCLGGCRGLGVECQVRREKTQQICASASLAGVMWGN